MTDTSNAEYAGPLSNGPGDSAGASHSGVDGPGAVTGPEGPEATQSGVHADTGTVAFHPDNFITASREGFQSALHKMSPATLDFLSMRWGGEFDSRLGVIQGHATAAYETLGEDGLSELWGQLAEEGWLGKPAFWDMLSRMSPGQAAAALGPTPQRKEPTSMPGSSEDMKGTLDGLRRRQRELARSGSLGSVEALALQPQIDALDQQLHGSGPIIGKQGRNS